MSQLVTAMANVFKAVLIRTPHHPCTIAPASDLSDLDRDLFDAGVNGESTRIQFDSDPVASQLGGRDYGTRREPTPGAPQPGQH
ncbi:MAG: hypothetical protein ACK5LN_14650 [Propioniciclava sp.]